jgi:hypothetical protein
LLTVGHGEGVVAAAVACPWRHIWNAEDLGIRASNVHRSERVLVYLSWGCRRGI